ncbi:MAG: hypothetical protein EAZ97_03155 [Bacteroidetes bacterium]|nr:MAG: hypothetical protein EAZ97_03155 [Bacteroidota bacterium]
MQIYAIISNKQRNSQTNKKIFLKKINFHIFKYNFCKIYIYFWTKNTLRNSLKILCNSII